MTLQTRTLSADRALRAPSLLPCSLVIVLCLLSAACAKQASFDRPIPAGPALASGEAMVTAQSAAGPELLGQTEHAAPSPVKHLLAAADRHLNDGELNQAHSVLQRAQRLAPLEPGGYYYSARLRQAQGDKPAALSLLDRALSLSHEQGRYYARIVALKEQLEGIE